MIMMIDGYPTHPILLLLGGLGRGGGGGWFPFSSGPISMCDLKLLPVAYFLISACMHLLRACLYCQLFRPASSAACWLVLPALQNTSAACFLVLLVLQDYICCLLACTASPSLHRLSACTASVFKITWAACLLVLPALQTTSAACMPVLSDLLNTSAVCLLVLPALHTTYTVCLLVLPALHTTYTVCLLVLPTPQDYICCLIAGNASSSKLHLLHALYTASSLE